MATATATFYVGKSKLIPYHIQVDQRSNWHHQFVVTVSTEKAKVLDKSGTTKESVIIENAIAYVGESIEIEIKRESTKKSFKFKGIVTDVQFDYTYAGDSFIIFKGYSPSYLLEGQKSVKTYEAKTLEAIFNDSSKDIPGNIKKEVKPLYTKAIPYVVKYKETQFEFLSRLANDYGAWFYYDGETLIFGDLPAQVPSVDLNFSSDSMLSFNCGVQIRPTAFKNQAYIYGDNGPVEKSVAGWKPGWLDPHTAHTLKAADRLFKEEGVDPLRSNIEDNNHIKHLAETKKASLLSDTLVFNGQSAEPGVAIGTEVKVNSKNGFIGKFRVMEVRHSFESNRDYNNYFSAIPDSSLSPPRNPYVKTPIAEPQVGVVTDNVDPENLGRVRVQLKWDEGTTPWVRVQTGYATKANGVAGIYFTPEIGDEVMVEFEQSSPDRPYVSGLHYHGNIPPEYADPDNNLKAIKTRSGHELVFDDKDGDEKILITDKKGNKMLIESSGDRIIIKSNNSIVIEAGSDVTVSAGKSISMSAGDTISLAAKTINLTAAAAVNVNALLDYNLTTTNKMESVKNNTVLKTKNLSNMVEENVSTSAKKIDYSAKESISQKSKDKITISAKNKLDQRAGDLSIASQKGKIKMKAKSNVEIKGKQVKTN